MEFVEVRFNVIKRFQLTLWFIAANESDVRFGSPDYGVVLTTNCYKRMVVKKVHRKTLHLQKSTTMDDFDHFFMMLRLTLDL